MGPSLSEGIFAALSNDFDSKVTVAEPDEELEDESDDEREDSSRQHTRATVGILSKAENRRDLNHLGIIEEQSLLDDEGMLAQMKGYEFLLNKDGEEESSESSNTVDQESLNSRELTQSSGSTDSQLSSESTESETSPTESHQVSVESQPTPVIKSILKQPKLLDSTPKESYRTASPIYANIPSRNEHSDVGFHSKIGSTTPSNRVQVLPTASYRTPVDRSQHSISFESQASSSSQNTEGSIKFDRLADLSIMQENNTCDNMNTDIRLRTKSSCSNINDSVRKRNFRSYVASASFRRKKWTMREIQAVICIQRWWKIEMALKNLRELYEACNEGKLVHHTTLMKALAPCLPILPLTPTDLHTEKQLQIIRSAITRCLRSTGHLQVDIDQLDLKIGLLLSNTMSIKDPLYNPTTFEATTVCSANGDVLDSLACGVNNKNDTYKKKPSAERRGTIDATLGLKALTKCSRDRLQGYQHLFYLLQTEPRYLATLIFALPTAKTTRFVENVVFSLFNYGANDRDNFLLINLFKTALEEEIRSKVVRLGDIVSGDPLVIKMIVSFVRKGPGRPALREILSPLVSQVIKDPQLVLNTNPVEIYQSWLNEQEMETGNSIGLPYNVSPDEALSHKVVYNRLATTISTLTRFTTSFCSAIADSRHQMPYALLYLAGVMKDALRARFTEGLCHA